MTNSTLSHTEPMTSDYAAEPEAIQDIEWRDAPYIVSSGFCMGTADVVPGVSGGTMAVALGIYRQLLAAITSVDVEALRALLRLNLVAALTRVHVRFLLSLVLGIGLAVVVMVKIVGLPHLVENSPKYVYAVFFGLVLASAIVLSRRIADWNLAKMGALVGGALGGLAVVNLVPAATPETSLFLFGSGAVAICAMLLPGISGSFLLLILGKYAYVLNAVASLDLSVLLPFALGAGTGLLAFSRVLAWALARWQNTVLASLTGLLIGSLWRIWPYQHLTTVMVRDKPRIVGAEPFVPSTVEGAVAALFASGLLAVLLLERFAATRKRADG